MEEIFSIDNFKKKKIEAMKTKNEALKNIVSLALGDADTMLKNHQMYVDLSGSGQEVSENEWLESHVSKQLKNLNSNLKIYKDRKDLISEEKVQKEIDCIKNDFFPQLTESKIKELFEDYMTKNPNDLQPRGFMALMKENYDGRYEGGKVSAFFKAEIKKRNPQ